MPLTGAAIAGVVVIGGLGFGGGYAVAGMGGDDGGAAKPPAKHGDIALPPVATPASPPKIVVLGSVPALPAPPRPKHRSRPSPSRTPGPSVTAAPSATVAPTPAPTSGPKPTPTSSPDIIEG